jgi:hypothetical protein
MGVNQRNYMAPERLACITRGDHMVDRDGTGYCNACGYFDPKERKRPTRRKGGLSIKEEGQIDEAVDEAMDRVRDSVLLSEDVGRTVGIAFLRALSTRIEELMGELYVERLKHGEGVKP